MHGRITSNIISLYYITCFEAEKQLLFLYSYDAKLKVKYM